ncbi:DUF927 domain-containing protein [Pseudoalteromonas sp. T1lg75]|uniref:DUF927 domain-containing protein n=1 Tax=Pseudoalteromonas sp. T1lg75 TaxID=2077102 RepID=UPI000CF5E897|nr:DUF927 domain-containing protein [Pseudoalteromonas sp. T1lg75]
MKNNTANKQCIAEAEQFFKSLGPENDAHFAIRLLKKGAPAKSYHKMAINSDSLASLISLNDKGWEVFVTINQTDGQGVKKENVTHVRALFADFDDPERNNREVIESLPMAPNMVIETSPGKYHIYFLVEDCPLEEFSIIQRALANHLGTDLSITDLPRIMRVPGFYHLKSTPFLSHIVDRCDTKYTTQEINEKLGLTKPSPDSTVTIDNNLVTRDPQQFEKIEQLSSEGGLYLLNALFAEGGPVEHLKQIGYGESYDEFISFSASLAPYLHTPHKEKMLGLWEAYLSEVGGNFDPTDNMKHLVTLTNSHPNALFKIADNKGWINPEKEYSPGFRLDENGVHKIIYDKSGEEIDTRRISSLIRVRAHTSGYNGANHGYLLEWRDKLGGLHSKAVPAAALHDHKPLVEMLSDRGLSVSPKAVNDLLTYLTNYSEAPIADATSTTGWYEDGSFVLPHHSYRPLGNSTPLYLQTAGGIQEVVATKGTLTQWQQEIGTYCNDNSRLITAVSCALAAPLLKPLGLENIGFHLVGDSSLGKSTALKVASSVYGPPEYTKTWRTTDNALEYVSSAYNDLLLPLDEIKQASADTIGAAIYMLAQGQGKERGKASGGLRTVQKWRSLILSTGERTPADILQDKGGAYAGQEVRLLNIPANTDKHGLFEELHGFKSGALFSQHLVAQTTLCYGHLGEAWLKYLVENTELVKTEGEKLMRQFKQKHMKPEYDGQVHRAIDKFALLLAAGELATIAGLTGWATGSVEAGITTAFAAYLLARGTSGKSEVRLYSTKFVQT